MVPKTAIIGAAGLVGHALLESFRRVHPDAVGTDWLGREGLPVLDLARPDPSPLRLAESGHTWIVITAGLRDLVECERDKVYSRERNVVGTLALARRLAESGLKVVFFSSNAVFDGEQGGYAEDAPTRPIQEYGRQKREVELGLPEATAGRCLILRIGRVVGVRKGDGTLPDEMARRLTAGERVDAAQDQVFTPTLVDDIPPTLQALQQIDAAGVFHVAGPEAWSRLQIARRLAERLKADPSLVREIALADVPGGAIRPKNLSLRCDRLRGVSAPEMTPFSRCLEKVVENYALKEARHAR